MIDSFVCKVQHLHDFHKFKLNSPLFSVPFQLILSSHKSERTGKHLNENATLYGIAVANIIQTEFTKAALVQVRRQLKSKHNIT